MTRLHKYDLYERAVQSPKTDIDWIVELYHSQRGAYPRRFREDFCGTFQLSCEWVKRNRNNQAIAVDLDPEPLHYGRKHHWNHLTPEQRRRLHPVQGDVLKIRSAPVDVVYVGNFSFYVLQQRELLVRYFQSVRRGLRKNGMFLLEMAGGPGMIERTKDRKAVSLGRGRKVTYIWDQQSFDPIQHRARYQIHFKLPDGRTLEGAFTYDWRLWTLPEVQDALRDAGFRDIRVFWEAEHRGEGTGEYLETRTGDNAYSWIAYVVALR